MKTSPLLIGLLTLGLSVMLVGCKTVGPISLVVSADQTQFDLVNDSGQTLHEVRVKGWIEALPVTFYQRPFRRAVWEHRECWETGHVFPRGLYSISLTGRCQEGRFRVEWSSVVQPR